MRKPTEYANGTWIEPEEMAYPNGAFTRRAKCLFPDGKLRIVRCSIADTYFSIPAKGKIGKLRLEGFIMADGPALYFHPYQRFNEYGHFHGFIPLQAVSDCSHAGDCSADVEYWQSKLGFNAPRERAINWLAESGGWTRDELADMADVELSQKVLWMACGDLKEHGEWYGLCS